MCTIHHQDPLAIIIQHASWIQREKNWVIYNIVYIYLQIKDYGMFTQK